MSQTDGTRYQANPSRVVFSSVDKIQCLSSSLAGPWRALPARRLAANRVLCPGLARAALNSHPTRPSCHQSNVSASKFHSFCRQATRPLAVSVSLSPFLSHSRIIKFCILAPPATSSSCRFCLVPEASSRGPLNANPIV